MDDKTYMRFLAACFALTKVDPKKAVQLADELMEELYDEKNVDNGIAAVVPKRKRSRNNS